MIFRDCQILTMMLQQFHFPTISLHSMMKQVRLTVKFSSDCIDGRVQQPGMRLIARPQSCLTSGVLDKEIIPLVKMTMRESTSRWIKAD